MGYQTTRAKIDQRSNSQYFQWHACMHTHTHTHTHTHMHTVLCMTLCGLVTLPEVAPVGGIRLEILALCTRAHHFVPLNVLIFSNSDIVQ